MPRLNRIRRPTPRQIAIGITLCLLLLGISVYIGRAWLWPLSFSEARQLAVLVDLPADRQHKIHLINLQTVEDMDIAIDQTIWHVKWSPDGRYITSKEANPYTGIVIDTENGRLTVIDWPYNGGHIGDWSSSNRYVFWGSSDQYGNAMTGVFDALEWKEIYRVGGTCVGDMSGSCKQGLVGIAPKSDRFLLEDGSLISLPDLTQSKILPTGMSRLSWSAWSPTEIYLAFLAGQHGFADTLYLAHGDGTEVQKIGLISESIFSVRWLSDESSFVLSAEAQDYILDMDQKRITVQQVANRSKSRTGQDQACCWSPDGTMLATGISNTLKIYDARYNLQREFPFDGKIVEIQWKPVP